MATNTDNRHTKRNRWSMAIWGLAAFLLLIPAVAMRFTAEVNWGPEDFIVMGLMLGIACGTYELVARMSSNTSYRAGAGVAIVTAFLTVWANLAVGMLGSEDNPANLLFAGVLFLAAMGAVLARFRARGMAHAMRAAALAQGAIALYALLGGYAEVVYHVGFFALPWLVSAELFARAAREPAGAQAAGR